MAKHTHVDMAELYELITPTVEKYENDILNDKIKLSTLQDIILNDIERNRPEIYKKWLSDQTRKPSSLKMTIGNIYAVIKDTKFGRNLPSAEQEVLKTAFKNYFEGKYYQNALRIIDNLNNAKRNNREKANQKARKANNKIDNTPHTYDRLGNEKMKSNASSQPLNQILFGPPGTGKTYHTIAKAVEIIDGKSDGDYEKDKKRFEELKGAGRIVFATFHQSYGYEEFVEGIKPVFDSGELKYNISSGIFKEICEAAKDYIKDTNNTESNTKRLDIKRLVNDFANDVENRIAKGEDIALFEVGKAKPLISAVNRKSDGTFQSFSTGGTVKDQSLTINIIVRDYENFINGKISKWQDIEPTYQSKSSYHGNAIYYWNLYRLIKKFQSSSEGDYWIADGNETKNYVLIIDEINRGNISKIFGELVTLIESSKRIGNEEELKVKLPYSGEEFGVPNNLYIIGTMNTSDRSIALMDTALRRRFDFVEMMPDYAKLSSDIEGINLQKALKTINERVEYLYDRDHTIGHAYLMGVDSLDGLNRVVKKKVIPLLQEYFYDDWKKIELVLGKGFIEKQETPKQIKDVFDDENIKDIYIVKSEFDWSAFKALS